jgi:hypothetical protein
MSSGIHRLVVHWKSPDVSEEHIASILRIETSVKQEASRSYPPRFDRNIEASHSVIFSVLSYFISLGCSYLLRRPQFMVFHVREINFTHKEALKPLFYIFVCYVGHNNIQPHIWIQLIMESVESQPTFRRSTKHETGNCLLHASRWFIGWRTLRSVIRRWRVPAKHLLIFTGLRGVISQKIELFVSTGVGIPDRALEISFLRKQAELYRLLHSTVKQRKKKRIPMFLCFFFFHKVHVAEVGRWYISLKWNWLFFGLRKYLGLRREQFRILHDEKFPYAHHLVLLGFWNLESYGGVEISLRWRRQ